MRIGIIGTRMQHWRKRRSGKNGPGNLHGEFLSFDRLSNRIGTNSPQTMLRIGLFKSALLGTASNHSICIWRSFVALFALFNSFCISDLVRRQIRNCISTHSRYELVFFFSFFFFFFFLSGPGGFRSMFPYGFMSATCVGIYYFNFKYLLFLEGHFWYNFFFHLSCAVMFGCLYPFKKNVGFLTNDRKLTGEKK